METIDYPNQLNEETWDQCQNLWVYGEFFDPDDGYCDEVPSNRKFRLMVVAALRAIWDHIPDPRSRATVVAAERFADVPDPTILSAAEGEAELAEYEWGRLYPYLKHDHLVAWMAWQSLDPGLNNGNKPTPWVETVDALETGSIPGRTKEEAADLHLRLFRDIFGNPFRRVTFSPDWRTDTAVALARTMYEARAFDGMPILADALQDAGCDSDDILNHCRDTAQVHVRGCWVCDLVLGKS
jgi:hypothetical protein